MNSSTATHDAVESPRGTRSAPIRLRRSSRRALNRRIDDLEKTLIETREYLIESRQALIEHLRGHLNGLQAGPQ